MIRRLLIRGFPYAIFFVVSDETVTVIAVLHASRNPQYWVNRR